MLFFEWSGCGFVWSGKGWVVVRVDSVSDVEWFDVRLGFIKRKLYFK